MTQIVNISSSENAWHDIQKAIYKFEQEYDIKPHLYANPDFASDCVEMLEQANWIAIDTEGGSYYYGEMVGYGEVLGCTIELDPSVENGVVILKG